MWIFAAGVAAFGASYLGFAVAGAAVAALALPFVLARLAIGCVETAEHAAVAAHATAALRGTAFGLLATVQAIGNLAAAVASVMWAAIGPAAAFPSLAGWTLLAVAGLAVVARSRPA